MTEPILVSHPVITIGVPFYNEGPYLEETLASLRRQEFGDFAVLMTDNCSNDGSAAIARRHADADPRFHLIRQPENIGALANFVFAFRSSDSPFFMWLGGHDMVAPSFLGTHINALRSDPRLTLSYSFARVIDLAGREISTLVDPTLSTLRAPPAMRYVQVPRHGHGYLVNNVFRRVAISDFDFEFSPIWDAVLLSHAIYKGHFHCVEKALYILRDIHPAGSETIESVVARVGGKSAHYHDNAIGTAYERDFRKIARWDPLRPLCSVALRLLLRGRYDPAPGLFVRSVLRLLRILRRR